MCLDLGPNVDAGGVGSAQFQIRGGSSVCLIELEKKGWLDDNF